MTLAKKLKAATVADILKSYDLPHRFTTYFYSQVARDLCSKAKFTDPRFLKAIDISERFGLGESFSESELTGVRDGADAAYSASAYSSAASAAYSAASSAASSASSYYAYSAPSSYYAYFTPYTAYKPLLLKLIQTRLTKVERLIIFGVEE